jgi:hypothetical protein
MRGRLQAAGFGLLVGLAVAVGCSSSTPPKAPPQAQQKSAPQAAAPAPGVDAGALVAGRAVPDGGNAPEQEAPKEQTTVKISIRAVPARPKSKVFWGKKLMGETPLDLVRPRDSGPVDLVVKNDGFFNVHTRAYTYKNDVLYVKLTKLADKMKLLGAKQEIPPPEGMPDGGVPPPP